MLTIARWGTLLGIASSGNTAGHKHNVRTSPYRQLAALGLASCVVAHATWAFAAEPPSVWHEQHLAGATIGLDATGIPSSRRLYLVSFGPDLKGGVQAKAQACSAKAIAAAAKRIKTSLAGVRLPAADGVSLKEDELAKAYKDLDAALDGLVDAGIKQYNSLMASCAAGRFDANAFHLGLVQRVCDDRTQAFCGPNPIVWSDAAEAIAFTALSRWADVRDASDAISLRPNVAVLLPELSGQSKPLVVLTTNPQAAGELFKQCEELAKLPVDAPRPASLPRLSACQALALASRPFKEMKAWPEPKSPAEAQLHFEALTAEARSKGRKLERNAARLADLPREVAFRLVDVLSEPQEAVLDLRSVATARLASISDEIARARLAECARYRGIKDTIKIAECAGYKVDNTLLQDCLAGGRCVPELGPTAYASVLTLIKAPKDLQTLAVNGELPRIDAMLAKPIDAALKPLGECAKKPNRAEAAQCLLEKQLGEKERRAVACFQQLKGSSEQDKLGCALDAQLPQEAQSVLGCAKQYKDRHDQLLCTAAATVNMPREVALLVQCQIDAKPRSTEQLAKCFGVKMLPKDAAQALDCVRQHPGKSADAAVCFGGSRLPPDATKALACIQKSAAATEAAVCYGADKMPENLRKPVQCLAESGGEPLGASICMASDSLSPEQRIILQCLASTGGEPTAMAICVGGNLAMKEFFNCVDKRVFEDNCVGKNNEFRKLVENLTGQKLTPNTVVGKVLNVQLDVVKTQVAIAQATVKGTAKLAENIVREHERAAKHVARELAKAPSAIGTSAERFAGSVRKEAEKTIRRLTPKVKVRVKL